MMPLGEIKAIFDCLPTPSVLLETNAPDFTIVAFNKAFSEVILPGEKDIIGKPFFEAFPINADDDGNRTDHIKYALDFVLTHKKLHQIERHRYDLPDRRYWKIDTFPLFDASGEMIYIVQSSTDITSLQLAEEEADVNEKKTNNWNELNQLERNVLELHSKGEASMSQVLSFYMTGLEALMPQMTCSILRVRNNCLYNWASPSLPASLISQYEGAAIGPKVGSCGTAAYLKEKVVVEDISTDDRWEAFKGMTKHEGYNSCWSYPIIDSNNEVMATFAIYCKIPAVPGEQEQDIIERVTSLLAVIIENRQYAETINENSQLMAQGQELAQFGNWSWEIEDNVVSWSDTLYDIYGINKQEFKATFEAYQDLLHPEDKKRVYDIITAVLERKTDIGFEERIVRPGGEIRHLRSWGTVKCNEEGQPVKMIGACLDITESKKTQEELLESEARLRNLVETQVSHIEEIEQHNVKLKDIAWAQSHLVRGPLARVLALVQLLNDAQNDQDTQEKIISYLEASAKELDEVIKNIIDRSQPAD